MPRPPGQSPMPIPSPPPLQCSADGATEGPSCHRARIADVPSVNPWGEEVAIRELVEVVVAGRMKDGLLAKTGNLLNGGPAPIQHVLVRGFGKLRHYDGGRVALEATI